MKVTIGSMMIVKLDGGTMKYICNKCEHDCVIDVNDCSVPPKLCPYYDFEPSWERHDLKPWRHSRPEDQIKDAYMVMGYPDYPMFITTSLSAAQNRGKGKYRHGDDCPIRKTKLFYTAGRWYGPVNVIYPSEKEEEEDARIERRNQVIERAKELGMTDEEIKLLGE